MGNKATIAKGDENLGNKIHALLFMDDAEGYEQEKRTPKTANELCIKHQIDWGNDKCKVMDEGTNGH